MKVKRVRPDNVAEAGDKEQAIAMAKNLGGSLDDIDMKNKDPKYWRDLKANLKIDIKYNQLVDNFKKEKDKLFAKRKMNAVLKEVKTHQRKRIEITIPVKSDPPSVTKEDVITAIGDIDFNNYNVAF